MDNEKRTASRAGLFDVRNIIGLLLAIYGAVLVLTGLLGTSSQQVDKAAGVNANLWSGIVMLLVAAFLMGWAKLRPTVVDDVEDHTARDRKDDPTGDGTATRTAPRTGERPGAPEER